MTLDDIKTMAWNHPEQLEINWDKLENPTYRQDFEAIVSKSLLMIPMLETLYTKLEQGEHITVEGEDTSLNYDEIETYKALTADELFSGYQLLDMYSRYLAVNQITD